MVALAWIVPTAWYSLRGIAASHTASSFPDALKNVDSPGYRQRWTYPPVLLILLIAFTCSGLPATITFRLSKSDMDGVATQVIKLGVIPQRSRVGFYAASDIERVAGGMRFTIPNVGFLTSHGFAFFPDNLPPVEEGYFYEHVQGPWYRWTYSD